MTGPDLLTLALAVLLLLGLVAWYLASVAARLDRLHHRVEGAVAALDNQLVRRAAASRMLATSGLLDPASAVLVAGAAAEAISAGEAAGSRLGDPVPADREVAESDLSGALRATLTDEAVQQVVADPMGRDLLADLGSAAQRVTMARRFHNDAVSQARRVRAKRLVRWSRLAGRASWPRTIEMDDEPPPALSRSLVPGGGVDGG